MSSSTASSHPALEADAHLLICCACGTQYPYTASHPRSNAENGTFDCLICLDDRQFVPPATGQRWTTLWTMTTGKSEERVCSSEEIRGPVKEGGERHEMEIVPDEEDPRMSYIVTKPSFGIAQTREYRRKLLAAGDDHQSFDFSQLRTHRAKTTRIVPADQNLFVPPHLFTPRSIQPSYLNPPSEASSGIVRLSFLKPSSRTSRHEISKRLRSLIRM